MDAFLTWRRTHDPDGGKLGKGQHLSGRPIEKGRAVLGRIFRIVEKGCYRAENPVRNTEVPKYDTREPVILSDEALLKACRARDGFLYLYAPRAGRDGRPVLLGGALAPVGGREALRRPPLDRLRVQGPAHQERKGPLGSHDPAAPRGDEGSLRLLSFAQYERGPTPWVFHHTTPRKKTKPGDRIESLCRSSASAVEKAKLPDDFVPHDRRHRRVTKWLAEEKSPVLVQEAVGHADISTTMRYSHLAREHLRALVDDGRQRKRKRAPGAPG